jgi:hypothetical protein
VKIPVNTIKQDLGKSQKKIFPSQVWWSHLSPQHCSEWLRLEHQELRPAWPAQEDSVSKNQENVFKHEKHFKVCQQRHRR